MSSERRWGPKAIHPRPCRPRGRGSGVLTGVALVVVGALFLIHNLGLASIDFSWRAWPLILVVFGFIRLIERSDRNSGLWLVAIGLWLYVNENALWGLDYDNSWPFLLVFGGLMMVGKALRAREAPPPDEDTREGGTT